MCHLCLEIAKWPSSAHESGLGEVSFTIKNLKLMIEMGKGTGWQM